MQIDLNDLAAGYAHRPTTAAGAARARRAAVSAGLAAGDVAVDIGGGRGSHAQVWLESGAIPIVVDPAAAMVGAAALVPGVIPVRAAAQRLPLRTGCAHLAYFHLSIHYGDWQQSLNEACRVLSQGGECWVWTMGAPHHRASFLARWFPSIGEIDAARFPDPAAVAAHLGASTNDVATGRETETVTRTAGSWRAAVTARFVSTLQLVPPDEFASGLAAFDAAHPNPDESIQYHLTFDWIRARV